MNLLESWKLICWLIEELQRGLSGVGADHPVEMVTLYPQPVVIHYPDFSSYTSFGDLSICQGVQAHGDVVPEVVRNPVGKPSISVPRHPIWTDFAIVVEVGASQCNSFTKRMLDFVAKSFKYCIGTWIGIHTKKYTNKICSKSSRDMPQELSLGVSAQSEE